MLRKTSKWIPGVLIVTTGRFRLPGILCLAVVLALCPMIPAPAEEIAYPGVSLQNIPGLMGGSDCLAPSGSNTGKSDSLSDNKVTVLSGGIVPGNVYGAYNISNTNVIANNAVFIYGNVNNDVYGCYNQYGDVTGNTVTISGGTVGSTSYSGTVYGGESHRGNAVGNSVIISDGAGGPSVVGFDVFGGASTYGYATGNSVTISGGTIKFSVYGAYTFSNQGKAVNNSVTISGGTVEGSVSGGRSNSGNVMENSVRISGGTVGGVYGGHINTPGSVGNISDNTIEISGGTTLVKGNVYGGHFNQVGTGNVERNTVAINGGTMNLNVFGGSIGGGSGSVTGNMIAIRGGTVNQSVYGGYISSGAGNAADNRVTISGGAVNQNVYGGRSNTGAASGNSVTVNAGPVGGNIYGGYVSSGTAAAAGNVVTISGGTVSGAVHGGRSVSGNAAGNLVNIKSGTVNGDVSGGWSNAGSVTDNIITVSGGTVGGNIHGGYMNSGSGNATGNTVTLSGTPNLAASNIYGGSIASGTGDVFTGNTFNLYNTSLHNVTQKITAAGLANFQNLNFYVPSSAKNGDTMLEITDTANIDKTRIKVVFDVANSSLTVLDKITLIDTDSPGAQLIGMPENMVLNPARGIPLYSTKVRKGALMVYDVEITLEQGSGSLGLGQLVLSILGGEVLPEAGAITDGYLPGLMQLNQGGNLVAGQTLAGKMLCAAKHPGFLDLGVFCDISGNWSRYHTGAQTDLSGTNLIVGLSRCFKLKPLYKGGQVTQLMLGGFFEHGNGSYDSLSAFDNGATVRAGGKLDSCGGGVLGRWDFGKFRVRHDYAHSYIDGGFRAGSLRNRFHSDLCDSFDTPAGFTSNSPYHGTHVGVGRVRHFASGATFDLSGKYFWTHMQGESLELTTGDPVDFESVNSHRFRLGGRYNFVPSRRVTPYLGGAWEREFGGTARASTNGFAITASSLPGDTGIGEVGIALKPATSRGFFIDRGVHCYGGKRDGVAAALYAGRNF